TAGWQSREWWARLGRNSTQITPTSAALAPCSSLLFHVFVPQHVPSGQVGHLAPFSGYSRAREDDSLYTSKRDGTALSALASAASFRSVECLEPKPLKASVSIALVFIDAVQCLKLLVK